MRGEERIAVELNPGRPPMGSDRVTGTPIVPNVLRPSDAEQDADTRLLFCVFTLLLAIGTLFHQALSSTPSVPHTQPHYSWSLGFAISKSLLTVARRSRYESRR